MKNKILVVWGVTACDYIDSHLHFKLHVVTSQYTAEFTAVRNSNFFCLYL